MLQNTQGLCVYSDATIGSYNRKMYESFLPNKTPAKHNPTLRSTYNPPRKNIFFSNKVNASSENVEKVVKPPHTPVFQNKSAFGDFSFTIPITNPIANAPIKFVIKVINGKSVLQGIRLIVYLNTDPSAPPSATNKKPISFSRSLYEYSPLLIPIHVSYHYSKQPKCCQ